MTHVPDPGFEGRYMYTALFAAEFFEFLMQDDVRIVLPGREVVAGERRDLDRGPETEAAGAVVRDRT